MNDQARQTAFMSALTTEHFVLQSAASTTVSEAAARATLYVFSLSSSLVAMGFAAQTPGAFAPFVATIIPAMFVLGIFTVVRLVDTGIENWRSLNAMRRIRHYFRGLTPEAAPYFSVWGETEAAEALNLEVPTREPLVLLFTAASMVAAINSIVGGAGVALLAVAMLGRERMLLCVLFGLAAAAIAMGVFWIYQGHRYRVQAMH